MPRANKRRRNKRARRASSASTDQLAAVESVLRVQQQKSDEAFLSQRFQTPETYVEPKLNSEPTEIRYPIFREIRRELPSGGWDRLIEVERRVTEDAFPYAPRALGRRDTIVTEYAIPETWDACTVRAWLRGAIKTAKQIGVGRIGPSGKVTMSVDVVRDVVEAYGYGETRTIVRPTMREIDIMDFVLPDWLLAVDAINERLAVIWRAHRKSWRDIGARIGRNKDTAKKYEAAGITQIADYLNAQG